MRGTWNPERADLAMRYAEMERDLKAANKRIAERTWAREFAQPIFDEARPKILQKIKDHDARE
jgi:hypothetical protein